MGGGGGGSPTFLPPQPNDTIHVNGLPGDFSEGSIKDTFGPYGTIKWSKLMGAGRKSALGQFATVDEATFVKENPEVLGLSVSPQIEYQRIRADGKGWQAGNNQQASGPKAALPLPGGMEQL